MRRRPNFRMRAVQYTCSLFAGTRNAVFSSEVRASPSTPSFALMASHMAQSAAAISAGPLMMRQLERALAALLHAHDAKAIRTQEARAVQQRLQGALH